MKKVFVKKTKNYLKYLFKKQLEGFHVSEEIALIKQNSLNQDANKRFIPTNRFSGED